MQDVSIRIINVTYNDSGVYECHVLRKFEFDFFTPSVSISKDIKLWVKEKGAANIFPNFASMLVLVLSPRLFRPEFAHSPSLLRTQ